VKVSLIDMRLFNESMGRAGTQENGWPASAPSPRGLGLQSAMEYLMTYGWAILIIAVVLGALFGLGFFSAANLAPKITGGSCQVYRPDGAGTASFINLVGTCNNELPQYVASFSPGADSQVNVGLQGLPQGDNGRSVFAWVYFTGNSEPITFSIFGYGNCPWQDWDFDVYNGMLGINDACGGTATRSSLAVPTNTWVFVGVVFRTYASQITFYLNGVAQNQSLSGFNTGQPINSADIGCTFNGAICINSFSGSIANVQVYNTSLSSNEVASLYNGGIGGVPSDLNNLVGWWPLNGNPNDYSGNLNNGNFTNTVYTSSWALSYVAP